MSLYHFVLNKNYFVFRENNQIYALNKRKENKEKDDQLILRAKVLKEQNADMKRMIDERTFLLQNTTPNINLPVKNNTKKESTLFDIHIPSSTRSSNEALRMDFEHSNDICFECQIHNVVESNDEKK